MGYELITVMPPAPCSQRAAPGAREEGTRWPVAATMAVPGAASASIARLVQATDFHPFDRQSMPDDRSLKLA